MPERTQIQAIDRDALGIHGRLNNIYIESGRLMVIASLLQAGNTSEAGQILQDIGESLQAVKNELDRVTCAINSMESGLPPIQQTQQASEYAFPGTAAASDTPK